MNYRPEDFSVEVVSHETASNIFDYAKNFRCGNSFIDDYFQNKAAYDLRNAYYAMINKQTHDTVGLAAVSCTGVRIDSGKLEEMIPSVIINYFAISTDYQHLPFPGTHEEDEFKYSDHFLCSVINQIRDLSTYVGVIDIVLYSVKDAVNFYGRNGFEKYEDYMTPENYKEIDECIPMFLPIN